jgi:hypothetical protein
LEIKNAIRARRSRENGWLPPDPRFSGLVWCRSPLWRRSDAALCKFYGWLASVEAFDGGGGAAGEAQAVMAS